MNTDQQSIFRFLLSLFLILAPTIPAFAADNPPIILRSKAESLTPKDVKSMLHKYRFYATCWNYNGEFCNPDGDFQNRFIDNQDGTVTDEATRLMWHKGGSPGTTSWLGAKGYVDTLNRQAYAGYSDWRVPTLEELASLMESSWKNLDLFIDPVFDRAQRYCWSADAHGVTRAWKANFHLGFLIDFPMTSKNAIRPVRSLP